MMVFVTGIVDSSAECNLSARFLTLLLGFPLGSVVVAGNAVTVPVGLLPPLSVVEGGYEVVVVVVAVVAVDGDAPPLIPPVDEPSLSCFREVSMEPTTTVGMLRCVVAAEYDLVAGGRA